MACMSSYRNSEDSKGFRCTRQTAVPAVSGPSDTQAECKQHHTEAVYVAAYLFASLMADATVHEVRHWHDCSWMRTPM